MARDTKRYSALIATEGKFSDAKYREEMGHAFGLDMRTDLSSTDIRDIYNDTRSAMSRIGHIPVVKIGHDDHDQRAKGHVVGLKLVRAKLPSGKKGLGIQATFDLYRDVAADFETGRYPRRSIEMSERGGVVDTEGKPYGLVLDGFALLGTKMQGIMHLPPVAKTEAGETIYLSRMEPMKQNRKLGLKGFVALQLQRVSTWLQAEASPEEAKAAVEEGLDFEAVKAAPDDILAAVDRWEKGGEGYDAKPDIEAIKGAVGVIAQFINDVDAALEELATEMPAEGEAPPEGEMSRVESKLTRIERALAAETKAREKAELALKKQADDALKAVTQKERDDVFAKLHQETKVVKEDREVFDLIAASKGLEYARLHFSGKAPTTPGNPNGIINGKEQPTGVTELAALETKYKKFGLSEKEAKVAAEKALALLQERKGA